VPAVFEEDVSPNRTQFPEDLEASDAETLGLPETRARSKPNLALSQNLNPGRRLQQRSCRCAAAACRDDGLGVEIGGKRGEGMSIHVEMLIHIMCTFVSPNPCTLDIARVATSDACK
jgi:hypothetical protein